MLETPAQRILRLYPTIQELEKYIFLISESHPRRHKHEGTVIQIKDSGPFYEIHSPPITVRYRKVMGMPTLSDQFVAGLKKQGYRGYIYSELIPEDFGQKK